MRWQHVPAIADIFANVSPLPPPQSRELSAIVTSENWHALMDDLHKFDATATDTEVKHREASRFISTSQFGSGSWLNITPDATLPFSRQHSTKATIAILIHLVGDIKTGQCPASAVGIAVTASPSATPSATAPSAGPR